MVRRRAGVTQWVVATFVLLGCGVAPSPGPGADGGGSVPVTCSTDPTEPNDTKERAFPLSSGTAVTACLPTGDDDYFSVTAGPESGGGYFVVSLTTAQQATPGLTSTIFAPGSGTILSTQDALNPVTMYWASRPGLTWAFNARQPPADGGAPLAYEVRAVWTPLTDAYEPNDTQADAKPITLGTPVQAMLVGARRDGNLAQTEYLSSDWYQVTVPAGRKVRATLSQVPLSVTAKVGIYCTTCFSSPDAEKTQSSPGQDVTVLSTPLSGAITVRVMNTDQRADVGQRFRDLPAHFTQPYTLTVALEP